MSQERRPLLPRSPQVGGSSSTPHSEQESFSSSSRTYVTEVREEIPAISPQIQVKWDTALFYNLLVDSLPVILSYILQHSVQTVSILIVGRLGPDELACAAFSLMLAFVTGWIIALGGTTALDTLGSQSYGSQKFSDGASRSTDLSVHFQRCLILLWILVIPMCVLWAFVEPVLLALGEPPELCRDVQRFLRVLIWGAPGYIGFESLKKYLQCQEIMGASTIVLIAVSPINIALNIWLIHYTSLGILGSPAALSITYWLCFLFLALFTARSEVHKRNKTWGGIQLRKIFHLRSCATFLRLALPGILMVGTEWAAFEIVALAAGRLGSVPLAAQSVIMTTDQILNTLPFGIGVAASNRVGNLIGARSPIGAKYAAHAAALLSVIVGTIVMIALLATKDIYGYAFSDSEEVAKLVSKVMPLVASFQVADGLAGSCGGVLRGQGRQHLGALFNIVAYYVLALPLGITLAFHPSANLGLQGLWIGQVIALFIVGLGEYATVWASDWNREIQKGIERTKEEEVNGAVERVREE